eukprot:5770242-Pyramimonas_sp.AAC.1
MAEKEPGILHKITKPPVRREEEVATPSGVICCPAEIVDLKAETFKATWTDPGNPHDRHCQNLVPHESGQPGGPAGMDAQRPGYRAERRARQRTRSG